MPDIKTKKIIKDTIKQLDKGIVLTEKIKENIVSIKEKSENSINYNEGNANEYAISKINNAKETIINSSRRTIQKGKQSIQNTTENINKYRLKIKNSKTKLNKRKIAQKGIKKASKGIKGGKTVIKEGGKTAQRVIKLAQKTVRLTYKGIKLAIKATISSVKAIIKGTKALISAIMAGGWVVIVIILVICLVALLCASIYGIFFSGEQISPNSITMKDAISECNQEFTNRIQAIQNSINHDDYVLEGKIADWKDILIVYAVKQSNGTNEQEVITMNNYKKQILKDIFWDMNIITAYVKTEKVIEKGTNTDELPKEVQKSVLHIKINSKTAEQMKNEYHFNNAQLKQYAELSSNEYSMLWSGIIYGIDSGEYIGWKQNSKKWANIKIGKTNSTIGDIGCLVTSIAILIRKSSVSTESIIPFNPGTFVEALNKKNGFDSKGNLQYGSITKIIPNFKYIGKVNLRTKSKEEKAKLISQYFNAGYYLTVEVKGATPGNQHWVAVVGINGNNIIIADPSTNHTDLWSAYEVNKISQFNYFKAN